MPRTRTRQFLVPAVLSALILAVRGVPIVTDAAGGSPPWEVSLHLPAGYLATSPVSRALDALSILSTAQSVAVFLSLAAIVSAVTLLRGRGKRTSTARRLTLSLGALLVSLAAIEAAVVFAPRPMAQLRVASPDVVVVDFHSHTGTSHDVRKSFSAEDNRAWHRGAGFHIGYISDHVKFGGAIEARSRNPMRAGDGTSLLTAVEGRYHRIMSTIVLGLTERDSALLNRRGNVLSRATASGRVPVTIVALPNRNLDSVTLESLDSLENFKAIELVDAAPRGLAQLDREEERIRALATRLGLILVSGSNNHGWGRTAAAWNLMEIPGWRALSPEHVGLLIEDKLRTGDSTSVQIIRRTRPGVHGVAVAATLPVILYQTVGSLTTAERLVWIGIVVLVSVLRQRRR